MTDTICNKIVSHLTSLTATNTICNSLGQVMTFGKNLFIGMEPSTATSMVTIIPFGGAPPNIDGNRQEAGIQMRVKASTRQKALGIQQSVINHLHMNELNGEGKMFGLNSAPLLLEPLEGGEWLISASNFTVKYLKI